MPRRFSFKRSPASKSQHLPSPAHHTPEQCSDKAAIPAGSDDMQTNVQLVEQASVSVAPLSPSTGSACSPNTGIPAFGSSQDSDRVLSAIPAEAFTSTAQAFKFVSAVVKPVPWLGPAAELVVSIIALCQKVGKNRHAASELALHCFELLYAINEIFSTSNENSIHGMLRKLTSMLQRIMETIEEWKNLSFFKSLISQEIIADGIKKFHDEISQFFQRYMIVTQARMFDWMEAHERQTREDIAEKKSLFAATESKQILEDACKVELPEDVKKILSYVQRLPFEPGWKDAQRVALRENFAAMCSSTGELPPDIELHEDFLEKQGSAIHGKGTFDIYRGSCAGWPCAIKILRSAAYDHNTKRRFDRQSHLWRAVHAKDRGRHILPLIGVVYHVDPPNPSLCFVSPWMEKGDALQFVRKYDSVDRVKLITQIAEGLKVLHTYDPEPLVHGYLKCSNILITDFGEPLLADFGLLRIVEKEKLRATSCPDAVSAYRWMPPEMIICEGDLTPKSDIFMFGMTVLELMTEQMPFAHIKRDPHVLYYRRQGGRPIKPQGENLLVKERGLDDRLWSLLEKCWSDEPEDRPTIDEVLVELKSLPSPGV